MPFLAQTAARLTPWQEPMTEIAWEPRSENSGQTTVSRAVLASDGGEPSQSDRSRGVEGVEIERLASRATLATMCGRFAQSSSSERYARLFDLDDRNRGDLAPWGKGGLTPCFR